MTPPSRTVRGLMSLGAFSALACGAVSSSQPQPSVIPALATVASTDTTVRASTAALAEGRPWEATRLLAPLLRNPSRRTPAVVLRAAEAYLGWQGYGEALALLANEPWLGTEFSGYGHVLAARAALSVSPRTAHTDSLALRHALRALRVTVARAERGERETLTARAYDRLEEGDSARAHYLRAGSLIPETRDWMVLRAVQMTPDAAARARDLATVQGGPHVSAVSGPRPWHWRACETGRAQHYRTSGLVRAFRRFACGCGEQKTA